jgi:hypothetical protein
MYLVHACIGQQGKCEHPKCFFVSMDADDKIRRVSQLSITDTLLSTVGSQEAGRVIPRAAAATAYIYGSAGDCFLLLL